MVCTVTSMDELLFSGVADQQNAQASALSSARRGTSVEQMWRAVLKVFGFKQICLISGGQPRVSTSGIDQVVFLSPSDTCEMARQILAPNRVGDTRAVQAFTYDGTIAHSIAVYDWDDHARAFIFSDPWPGDSLLSAQQNEAGLDARPVGEHRWAIPERQFQRVLVALLVPPLAWADATGSPAVVTYEEIQASDFWTWFHVEEAERVARTAKLHFQGRPADCRLKLELDSKQRIITAELGIRRSFAFMAPFGLNPFAMDLAKSFIVSFGPKADHSWLSEVNEMLTRATMAQLSLSGNADAGEAVAALDAAFTGSEKARSAASSVMSAYYDPQASSHISVALGALTVASSGAESDQWTDLRFHLR
jgi:hypothetical protein